MSFRRRLIPRRMSFSRRNFLQAAGAGFGAIALAGLCQDTLAGELSASERPPHFAPRAKNVIWLFMDGGPSHLDLFDPKPELTRLAGQPLPASFKRPVTAMGVTSGTPLLPSPTKFSQYGDCGMWVSDYYPEIARCADDLCLVRSCTAEGQTHVGAVMQMNTGSLLLGRPSLGAWALYGLGTVNRDLPGYVVFGDDREDPPGGSSNWATGFMPAAYQGTRLGDGPQPILDIASALKAALPRQRSELDFLQRLNRRHAETRVDDRLDARIESYELAFRMQSAAPEAVDLTHESAATKLLYGMDQPETAANGRNCLLARRLVERGVRFQQIYMGIGSRWDAHQDLANNHATLCRETDRPIAGLIQDLKRRGLLNETLVIWGGEFGRTPMSESGSGRDHNPFGFSMFFVGGGMKRGYVHGATDDVGLYAIDKPMPLQDVHATILNVLGIDHEQLTYSHNGRDERLTGTEGRVVHELLA